MKRFTETTKFDDPWYYHLQPLFKLAWEYVLTKCDAAGVWDPNFGLAEYQIGGKVKWKEFLEKCDERIAVLPNGKWWITGFIAFQYGKLSKDCRPHLKVYEALNKHGIEFDENQALVVRSRKSHVSDAKKARVIARDGGRCVYCETTEDIQVDHVNPRKAQGGDEESNLVAACKSCNNLKSDRDITEFLSTHPQRERIIGYLGTLSSYPTKVGNNTIQGREQDKDKDDGESAERGSEKPKARGTAEELKAYCVELKLPESDGVATFDKWQGNGWTNGGKPMKDWRATIRSWSAQGYMPSQKSTSHGNPNRNSANGRAADDRDQDRTGFKPAPIPIKLL